MGKHKKITLTWTLGIVLVLLGVHIKTHAQTIAVVGPNWNVNVPSITEAGSNYGGTYDNANNITISGFIPGNVLNLLSGDAMQVTMRYVPTPSWHSSLNLYAKKTGGSASIGGICVICSVSVNGGIAYTQILPGSEVQLFRINFSGLLGLGNSVTYKDVQVQLRLTGLSVTTPVADYSADVVFTISAP